MANVLNLKRILLSPFSAKPFLFFGVADRAISLLPVFRVKRMPVFAVRLLRVEVRDRGTILHRVLIGAHALKMLMVNAGRIAASVIYNHAFLNGAKNIIPRYSMRSSSLTAQVEGSVSVLIQGRGPNNAAVLTRCSFGHKSGVFGVCKVHSVLLNGPVGYMDHMEV